jgi:hypothetical protein
MMHFRAALAFAAGVTFFQFTPYIASAQVDAPLCHPSVSSPIIVASPKQRYDLARAKRIP